MKEEDELAREVLMDEFEQCEDTLENGGSLHSLCRQILRGSCALLSGQRHLIKRISQIEVLLTHTRPKTEI